MRVSGDLSARQRNTISRISGLVLLNAMIFQDILAQDDKRVLSLQEIIVKDNLQHQFCTHWQFILERINYYPIFHLAREIVLDLTASRYIMLALRELAQTAQQVVAMRAALRHDLMGRVYHRLLAEAKYLGTYYTSIPSATLLLKLALRPDAWSTQWHDLEDVRQFRVVDLACGTGTLLMAAADSVTDNYVGARANKGQDIDHNRLQNALVEDVLYGYDVLASALHLTASTLSLRAPHIGFTRMRLFTLPLGGPDHRLGSIEYLRRNAAEMPQDLFGATEVSRRVTAECEEEIPLAAVPAIDLCVMNPPFTRSVGGNLLFGSVPKQQRRPMQEELKKLVRRPNVHASITAGLGSVFVATAHDYIKPGGRIALVLPKALLSGVAWDRTRRLFRRSYRVEYLIASHDPQRWNFSESTDLSEVLLVANKVNNKAPQPNTNVVAVNLWRNPSTAFDALAIAHALRGNEAPDIVTGQGAQEISIGQEKIAEAVRIPWNDLRSRYSWLLPCAFAQSDLIRAAYHLAEGNLWLPGYGEVGQVPLCPLGHLGDLGPDVRDIHDGFRSSKSATAFPAFWSHDAKAVFTLAQNPNAHLSPLPRAKKGRPLRKAQDLWPRSGRVLIAERLWLNTQSLVAVRLTQPVLSNVWWPFSLKKKRSAVAREKAMVLWLNSTLGLLLMLLHREETRGAWVKFKKPVLAALPVLDLEALSRDQLKALASTYDRLSTEPLQPLPNMNSDVVRAEIDRQFARVLDLPDFSILREMLAREPIVCLRPL
ncbi:hypothetical protein AMJ85_00355 [candidate division BRC1 bacterium SM23_51]|nr:MAG: hypothetical protein AMJ85_00355 [candidate division BRC1 bacterium SM23_51]